VGALSRDINGPQKLGQIFLRNSTGPQNPGVTWGTLGMPSWRSRECLTHDPHPLCPPKIGGGVEIFGYLAPYCKKMGNRISLFQLQTTGDSCLISHVAWEQYSGIFKPPQSLVALGDSARNRILHKTGRQADRSSGVRSRGHTAARHTLRVASGVRVQPDPPRLRSCKMSVEFWTTF